MGNTEMNAYLFQLKKTHLQDHEKPTQNISIYVWNFEQIDNLFVMLLSDFCIIQNNLGLLFWWKLCTTGLLFGQPWGKNVPICLAPRYLRLEPVGRYEHFPLQHNLPDKNTHAFILSSLFSLHYLLFHCLFFLTLPVQAVCVNGTLLCFVVGPLQAESFLQECCFFQ